MFDLQKILIDRINAEVPGFKTVANPSVLAGLREIGPLLPACIVMPSGGDPMEQSSPILPVVETQHWDIIVIIGHQYREMDSGLTEQVAGELMTGILKALHGWRGSSNYQHKGFAYDGREAPSYAVGYAEFPLHFTSKAVIGA